MRKHYTILAGTAFALTIAVGVALAQEYAQPRLIGRPDPELNTAKQSLDDALAHLQKARNADSGEFAKARACIELAEDQIRGFDSLAVTMPPPPNNRRKRPCG